MGRNMTGCEGEEGRRRGSRLGGTVNWREGMEDVSKVGGASGLELIKLRGDAPLKSPLRKTD
jgi:hypothetical protein